MVYATVAELPARCQGVANASHALRILGEDLGMNREKSRPRKLTPRLLRISGWDWARRREPRKNGVYFHQNGEGPIVLTGNPELLCYREQYAL
jgi:hypothetical protein